MASEGQQKLLYLFGDQTFELQPHLTLLQQHIHNGTILESFLKKAYSTIVQEIHKQPTIWKDELLRRVSSLKDLLNWNSSKDNTERRSLAIEMATVCLFHISTFILAQKEFPLWSGAQHNQARVLGFCTGALAAAAVSCSTTAEDLVELGVEAVGLAFRIGALVSVVCLNDAASAGGQRDQWAMAVLGPDAADVVESYSNGLQDLPVAERPHITAYTPRGVTVSGRPSALAKLRDSSVLGAFEIKELPLYGLYHAPHLFTQDDVNNLVSGSHAQCLRPNRISMMSGGGEVRNDNFDALLRLAVVQILREPLRWVKVVELVQDWCAKSPSEPPTAVGEKLPEQSTRLHITAFGSKAGHLLVKQANFECSLTDLP